MMRCDHCGKDFRWPADGGYGDISIRVFETEAITDGWDGLTGSEYLYFCKDCIARFLWENGRPRRKRCENCKHYVEEMCFEGEMKRDPYRLPYNTCEHWEIRC